jgi:hypothetical protein
MYLQLTSMVKTTPLTKSQAVIITKRVYELLHITPMSQSRPANPVSCIPQCLLDNINAEHEDQGADDHDSYSNYQNSEMIEVYATYERQK